MIVCMLNRMSEFQFIMLLVYILITIITPLIYRTLDGQNQSLIILSAMLLTERAITKEIALLMELKVYPTMELAMIRKDIKSFKDHQDFILCKIICIIMMINIDDDNEE